MPSLKDTKRRIQSVKNTQKITHAMKLVSAAKFARASHGILGARPYAEEMLRLAAELLQLDATDASSEKNRLLQENLAGSGDAVIVIGTDRGLCGNLNSTLFKTVAKFIDERKTSQGGKSEPLFAAGYGRRAVQYLRKTGLPGFFELEKSSDRPQFSAAYEIAKNLLQAYESRKLQKVYLAYPEFKSALTQMPTVRQLLPFDQAKLAKYRRPQNASQIPPIVEPDVKKLLSQLSLNILASEIYLALSEAYASEQAARMNAMDSATRNAKEIIRKLTLQYNRARQAAITKELIEITSGADAL